MLFFLSLLSTDVFAIPQTLSQQGRLLDISDVPIEGSHYLTFRLFESNIATQPLWEESLSINFENGFYRVILGADVNNPLDTELFATSPLFLEHNFKKLSNIFVTKKIRLFLINNKKKFFKFFKKSKFSDNKFITLV